MGCLCDSIAQFFIGPNRGVAAPDPLVGGSPRTYGGEGYSSPLTIDALPVFYPEVPTAAIKAYVETSIAYTRLAPVATELATWQPLADGERLADRAVRIPQWNTEWVQNYAIQVIENTMKPPLALPQYSYAEIDVNQYVDKERLRIARSIYGNESLGI